MNGAALDPNVVISTRRKELGLQPRDVAAIAGMGADAYRDLEQYADEAYTVVPLRSLRRVCDALGLNLLSLFGIEYEPQTNAALGRSICQMPRNRIVETGRVGLELSQAKLADRLGFDTTVIEQMESDEAYLEGWSLELIEGLAAILNVPVLALMNVCGDRLTDLSPKFPPLFWRVQSFK